MKVAILGTGNVGQTFAEKLISLGHEISMGTRNVKDTLESIKSGKPFADWLLKNGKVNLKTFKDAVNESEFIINALNGGSTIEAVQSCNQNDFDNKIIMDVANPLDFSQGFPPSLIEGLNNTNSLGEELQKQLPNSKVVKTLNTMWCGLMVNPLLINNGHHQNYICGNDKSAKEKVLEILASFGWENENILDLGDITNARGTEAILQIWTRIYGATQNGAFNFTIVK